MNTCITCGNSFSAKRSTARFCSGACKSKSKRLRGSKIVEDVILTVSESDALTPIPAPLREIGAPLIHIGNRFNGYKTLMHPNTPHCKDCNFTPDGNFLPNWFKRHIEPIAKGKVRPTSHQHALELLRTLLGNTEVNSKLGLKL